MSGRRPSAKSAREALVSFRSLPSLDPTLNEEDLAVAAQLQSLRTVRRVRGPGPVTTAAAATLAALPTAIAAVPVAAAAVPAVVVAGPNVRIATGRTAMWVSNAELLPSEVNSPLLSMASRYREMVASKGFANPKVVKLETDIRAMFDRLIAEANAENRLDKAAFQTAEKQKFMNNSMNIPKMFL